MNTFTHFFRPTLWRLVAAGTLTFTASFAQATFINFDDIPYVPEDSESPNFYDTELTDQYADKGLLVSDGYILPYLFSDTNPKSQPNYLLGGNVLTLSFTGDLPTIVSMYVTSLAGDTIRLNAYNSSGFLQQIKTKGAFAESNDPNYEEESPPNQFVSFDIDAGISRITVENFYNSRVSARIDDLTFTRKASVPEPSSLLLFALGFCALIWRRSSFKASK